MLADPKSRLNTKDPRRYSTLVVGRVGGHDHSQKLCAKAAKNKTKTITVIALDFINALDFILATK